jgi:hypothetical protein
MMGLIPVRATIRAWGRRIEAQVAQPLPVDNPVAWTFSQRLSALRYSPVLPGAARVGQGVAVVEAGTGVEAVKRRARAERALETHAPRKTRERVRTTRCPDGLREHIREQPVLDVESLFLVAARPYAGKHVLRLGLEP